MISYLCEVLRETSQWPQQVGSSSPLDDTEEPGAVAFLRSSYAWFGLGYTIPGPIRKEIRRLWSERPDLQEVWSALVMEYPCDEFLRILYRAAEQGRFSRANWLDWIVQYPELKHQLTPFLRHRAMNHRRNLTSIGYALIWARYFGGGEEAWRAIACAIKWNELRDIQRARKVGYTSFFPRHDLETHGTISPEEGDAINRHLKAMDWELLNVYPRGFWWQRPEPEAWRHEEAKGELLIAVARGIWRWRGKQWSGADEALLAEIYQTLSPAAQERYQRRMPDLPAALRACLQAIEMRAALDPHAC